MNTVRQIKKYPNRRLYDSTDSRYMTLADVRAFVVAGTEFVITDKTTHEDITDRILMQVLSDQEQSGIPMFGREFLLQAIRLYGSPLQDAVGECVRQSVNSLVLESRDAPLRADSTVMPAQPERSDTVAATV